MRDPRRSLASQAPSIEDEGEGAVRRQQFVFASSVLLTTGTSVHTIRAHPVLLRQLWQFVEGPRALNPVQLQYWCRCAGSLLLCDVSHEGPVPSMAGIGVLLRNLLQHLYSDAVALLIKCLLNLHPVAGRESPVQLIDALAEVLPTATERLLLSPECAHNAYDLLKAICEAIPLHADSLALQHAFRRQFTPLLRRTLRACLKSPRGGGGGGAAEAPGSATNADFAISLVCAALELERDCRERAAREDAAQYAVQAPLGEESNDDDDDDDPWAAPFAALVVERLSPLRAQLEAGGAIGGALQQMRMAELLASLTCAAPPPLLRALAAARVLRAALGVFFGDDCNGGGRQDFVRTLLLRGLSAALRCGEPAVHRALLHDGRLLSQLSGALGPRGRCSREHARLLLVELLEASRRPSLGALLAAIPGWDRLQLLAAEPVGGPRARQLAAAALLDCDDGGGGGNGGDAPPSPEPQQPSLPTPDVENVDPNQIGAMVGSPRPPLGALGGGAGHQPRAAPSSPTSPQASPASLQCADDDHKEATDAEAAPPPAAGTPPAKQRSPLAARRDGGAANIKPPSPPSMARRPSEDAPWSPEAARRAAAAAAAAKQHAPSGDAAAEPSPQQLLVVERESFRVAHDFSRDTPQPKLVSKRGYLHRRAKEGSPFGAPDGSPSPAGAGLSALFGRLGGSGEGSGEGSGSGASGRKHTLGEDSSQHPDSPSHAIERLNSAVKSLQFD